jgi:hypothetical protein
MEKKTWIYIGVGVLVLAFLYLLASSRNAGLTLPAALGGKAKDPNTWYGKLGEGVGSALGKFASVAWPDAGKSGSSGDGYLNPAVRLDDVVLEQSGV